MQELPKSSLPWVFSPLFLNPIVSSSPPHIGNMRNPFLFRKVIAHVISVWPLVSGYGRTWLDLVRIQIPNERRWLVQKLPDLCDKVSCPIQARECTKGAILLPLRQDVKGIWLTRSFMKMEKLFMPTWVALSFPSARGDPVWMPQANGEKIWQPPASMPFPLGALGGLCFSDWKLSPVTSRNRAAYSVTFSSCLFSYYLALLVLLVFLCSVLFLVFSWRLLCSSFSRVPCSFSCSVLFNRWITEEKRSLVNLQQQQEERDRISAVNKWKNGICNDIETKSNWINKKGNHLSSAVQDEDGISENKMQAAQKLCKYWTQLWHNQKWSPEEIECKKEKFVNILRPRLEGFQAPHGRPKLEDFMKRMKKIKGCPGADG